MSTTRNRTRSEKCAVILAQLNEPGGRQRTNAEIAKACKTNAQFVQRVRDENRTPEEQAAYKREREAKVKALDSVFPGIYAFYYPRQTGGVIAGNNATRQYLILSRQLAFYIDRT